MKKQFVKPVLRAEAALGDMTLTCISQCFN